MARIAPLLFASGFCSLVYQTVWLREFRLIFGASTAANGAVLAIFMGGLGLGGWLVGRSSDRHPRPLLLYAQLEGGIAVATALSPLLLDGVRATYLATGGTAVLGNVGATVVRLLLAALVLGVPTVLMGGTLPAAARAAQPDVDEGRHATAWLYGINTLGAVTGCLVGTFFMLEVFGQARTLWMACLLNALVALAARRIAMRSATVDPVPQQTAGALPPKLVLVAAALAGMMFLLMELVWYRMLAPILGGSVFTFGLVLAMALLGIGAGGALYAVLGARHIPRVSGFAATCLLEAAFMALPFVLGDRVAVLAAFLRAFNAWGFAGQVLGWSVVAGIVVFPAALVSGFQFPLLMALIGRGAQGVGRQVGLVYAANTVGSMAGSLLGGFGLIPALGAPGLWQLVCLILVAMGVVALVVAQRGVRTLVGGAGALAILTTLLMARGPTSMWRHGGVGVGRFDLPAKASARDLEDAVRGARAGVVWEADGVESSVAVKTFGAYALLINGKSDGSLRADASTQVMGGLLPALLVPQVRSALVVGLGTGCTGGWLARVPGIERVDVVELEPKMLEAARFFSSTNAEALDNPKMVSHVGDARELLLTSKHTYDVIFSEPSNPYRAGVASLYTQEFYRAARERLAPHGMFAQWVQGYEIEPATLRTVVATLASVFPNVQMWRGHHNDIILLGGGADVAIDIAALRARIQQEPFRSALFHAWRADDVESVLSRFLAAPALAAQIAREEAGDLNVDDHPIIEFAFARTVGKNLEPAGELALAAARERQLDRPAVVGDVDWQRFEDARYTGYLSDVTAPPDAQEPRARALQNWLGGDYRGALQAWNEQGAPPRGPTEHLALAHSLAELGDDAARQFLAAVEPLEAAVVEATLAVRQKRHEEALAALLRALALCRTDPWSLTGFQLWALRLIPEVAHDDAAARRILEAIREPFVGHIVDEARRQVAVTLADRLGSPRDVATQLAPDEPDVPFRLPVLAARLRAYQALGHPLLQRAGEDLSLFLAQEPSSFMR